MRERSEPKVCVCVCARAPRNQEYDWALLVVLGLALVAKSANFGITHTLASTHWMNTMR
jgi:hypothetical protein